MHIKSIEQLRDIYAQPKGRAKIKVLVNLEKHSSNFIKKSPFVIISSYSKDGKADCSPRGGDPGFVKIINHNTIVLPEYKGNNRLDSLTNMITSPSIGCLFMIPGIDETLRINGSVKITQEPEYLNLFSTLKNPPKCVIEIKIEELFLHCAKALMRSKLWSPEMQIERSTLPSMGKMLNDQLETDNPIETQKEMVERYQIDL